MFSAVTVADVSTRTQCRLSRYHVFPHLSIRKRSHTLANDRQHCYQFLAKLSVIKMSTGNGDNTAKKKVGRRSLKTPLHGDCQVCGQPGHGSHFGVLTCRACAAFFRRTVVMNRHYSCRRANGSCQISKDERYLCRLCRYNKCLSLGMTPENVQWNRDVLSTTVEGRKIKKITQLASDTDDRDDYQPQGLSKPMTLTSESSLEECETPATCITTFEDVKPGNEPTSSRISDSATGNILGLLLGVGTAPAAALTTLVEKLAFIHISSPYFLHCACPHCAKDVRIPPLLLENGMFLAYVPAVPSSIMTQEDTELDASSISLKNIGRPVVRFDISPIMDKLKRVLTEFRPDDNLPERPLERMHQALLRHRRFQLTEPDIKVISYVTFADVVVSWENHLYNIGEWLMHCKEFAQLPLEEKMIIFKSSWIIWQRFERLTMSIEIFGWRAVTEKLVAMSATTAIALDRIDCDMSTVTDYDPSYIKSLFEPFVGRLNEEVTKTCLELGITAIEVVYILCTLVWHVEGRPVSPETSLISESYRESISDDMHNYYAITMKTPNYAGRLIKIMSIVHCLENIHYERSKVMELARIFDVFKMEVSEKGMFDC